MARIELEQVSAGYGTHTVLESLDLVIEDGKLHALVGPSGCGKTTLLRLVAGFIQPKAGRVLLDGADISQVKPERRHMGIVFQNYALFPQMNVERNIAYGLKLARWDKARAQRRIDECLALVNLADERTARIDELSGGQQQRVAIARALAPQPSVLLLDEPMSNLDQSLRASLRAQIRSVQQQTGITMLFITHDRKEALSLSDTVSIMDAGRTVQTGTPQKLYEHPDCAAARTFAGADNRIGADLWRPEQLALAPLDAPREPADAASLTGTVSRVLYEGATISYTVNPDDTDAACVHVIQLNNARAFRPRCGDRVRVDVIA